MPPSSGGNLFKMSRGKGKSVFDLFRDAYLPTQYCFLLLTAEFHLVVVQLFLSKLNYP